MPARGTLPPDLVTGDPRPSPAGGHAPVMLSEVLAALAPRADGTYVDATFGGGGYVTAILDAAPPCRVWGIDRDPAAVAAAAALCRRYPDRLRVLHGRFGDLDRLLAEAGVAAVDGVALDLGMSSLQVDAAQRGFSFRADGPLDMRMDPTTGISAAEAVNTLSEADLAEILRSYGEERAARRIARAIVRERARQPIVGTRQLAELIHRVLPATAGGIDSATRTFQALRIYVNDELGELDRGLESAERVLAPGGRLCVVAYHSLEDRAVKAFLRTRSGAGPRPSRHRPDGGASGAPQPTFRLLYRRALRPSAAEIKANPRARSARLRAAERTSAPPWPPSPQRRDERRKRPRRAA